ncbi:hypothetical protein BU15DRAFT_82993 [Melanogaster broomeanus]|nr:hypothetical protein BU15DRAFT_82993 [Melanogaster broomeanus]
MRYVTSTTAHTTDDVSSEVALLWTVVFAVTKTPTILTDLVLIVAKGTIQGSKFMKLSSFNIFECFRILQCAATAGPCPLKSTALNQIGNQHSGSIHDSPAVAFSTPPSHPLHPSVFDPAHMF